MFGFVDLWIFEKNEFLDLGSLGFHRVPIANPLDLVCPRCDSRVQEVPGPAKFHELKQYQKSMEP